jgi:hypothetical protein
MREINRQAHLAVVYEMAELDPLAIVRAMRDLLGVAVEMTAGADEADVLRAAHAQLDAWATDQETTDE